MSAPELSEACNASVSTIYRRIERLQEYDLLDERLQLDRDGHHVQSATGTHRNRAHERWIPYRGHVP
ncbi:winged helix-turn-helix domain-containing protein [Halalkalicoccus sp. NIPERK01]|uniref:winged helix-turn-helix domain-containing protein n=1 Tax=Halalkalicoccus sp. NIPERK01 TaxID=3053469 RepID=UPI00256EC789|nr:winged helix-turn-helix domain-containing protein [Halalkalicoccus sp. NIPERK01]MDL5363278.1 winged helix-turn-helix domain-containing protein [Halalkalicoccus sp. NIPERK01]